MIGDTDAFEEGTLTMITFTFRRQHNIYTVHWVKKTILGPNQDTIHHRLTKTIHSTLKMTFTQVVTTSVTNKSSFQNYPHPHDHTILTTDTPGFKPFTIIEDTDAFKEGTSTMITITFRRLCTTYITFTSKRQLNNCTVHWVKKITLGPNQDTIHALIYIGLVTSSTDKHYEFTKVPILDYEPKIPTLSQTSYCPCRNFTVLVQH